MKTTYIYKQRNCKLETHEIYIYLILSILTHQDTCRKQDLEVNADIRPSGMDSK